MAAAAAAAALLPTRQPAGELPWGSPGEIKNKVVLYCSNRNLKSRMGLCALGDQSVALGCHSMALGARPNGPISL